MSPPEKKIKNINNENINIQRIRIFLKFCI